MYWQILSGENAKGHRKYFNSKEKEILSKSLSLAIPPTKLNFCCFLKPFYIEKRSL